MAQDGPKGGRGIAERDRAATAAIQRELEAALAAERPSMPLPRTRTPADAELAAAIDKIRADQPEWALAENVARAFDALSLRIDESERRAAEEAAACKLEAAAAEAEETKKRLRWVPLWRALKAGATGIALTIGGFTVNALINHGDSRRAAVQQAAVIDEHTTAIKRLTEVVTADHPIVQIVAARLGMAAPAFPSPPINP